MAEDTRTHPFPDVRHPDSVASGLDRKEAQAKGYLYYRDGHACRRGHTGAVRYSKSGRCVHCAQAKARADAQRNKDKTQARAASGKAHRAVARSPSAQRANGTGGPNRPTSHACHTTHVAAGQKTPGYDYLPLHLRKLEDARVAQGLGLREVSERAGMGRNTYGTVIREGRDMTVARWIATASALDIPILFGNDCLTPDTMPDARTVDEAILAAGSDETDPDPNPEKEPEQ